MSNTPRQYTIRNVPAEVDQVLKLRAKETGKSFNQTALEALIAGAGTVVSRRDLSFITGSLSKDEAKRLDTEIAAQRKIDRKLWK